MNNRKTLALGLIIGAGVLFAASVYVQQAQRELSLSLQIRIAEQAQILTTIANLTYLNQTDAVAEDIITDCSPDSRIQYETRINQLGSLSNTALIEFEPLFEACAGFFAEKKALMVSRLRREFDVYAAYIQLLSTIKAAEPLVDQQIEQWAELVLLEEERSQLMSEKVFVQASIITALKTESSQSDTVQSQLVRSQQITQRVAAVNGEIEAIRQELENL